MSVIAAAIPTYKKVKAIQTYETTAIMPFQRNKVVEFTIYKDSVYNVKDKNGEYEVLFGPFLITNAPKNIFEEYSSNYSFVPEIILLIFIVYFVSSPFWLPQLIKRFMGDK